MIILDTSDACLDSRGPDASLQVEAGTRSVWEECGHSEMMGKVLAAAQRTWLPVPKGPAFKN